MLWSSIPSNQSITFENLLEACNNGTFLQLLPMPPSGVSAKKCIRGDQIQSYVDIQSAPLSGTAANQTVAKSKIVANAYTYYRLASCGGGADAWTRLAPPLGYGQRYVLSGYPSPTYYYYNGATQTTLPSGFNGSIQIVYGATYCP